MLDRKRPFELPTIMKYRIHYRDGQTVEIPVVLEQQIEHWVQDRALPLAGARVGWSRPLPALAGKRAVLYSMQAENPRPQVEIEFLDAVRTSNRATPAVIAVTLGKILQDYEL